jgi:hypothetical protein
MSEPRLTRRRLLWALGGATAVAGFGSAAATTVYAAPVSMSESARVSERGSDAAGEAPLDLVVNWRATYNGRTLDDASFERSPGDVEGAVVFDLPGVLPGDTGTLVTELSVPEDAAPAAVSMVASLGADRENGINEPEAVAGDETSGPDGGELAEALEVRAWYDVGSVGDVGHRNGRRDPREPTIEETTLRRFAASDRRRLDVHPRTGGTDCLRPGDSLPVSLSWTLPEDVDNTVQTDSVRFDVGFGARPCSGEEADDRLHAQPPTDRSTAVRLGTKRGGRR